MRWLLFLSRVAFICGLFFFLSFTLLVRDWTADLALMSTIIVTGHIVGSFFIPLVNICYLGVLFIKRDLRPYVPTWLVVANVFLLLILGLYIYLHYGEQFASA